VRGLLDRLRATGRVAAEVFRNPSLRRVELAYVGFSAVEYGSWVALLLFAYEATGPESVGVVALIQLVPAAILAPALATLADRYRRERVILVAYVLLAVNMTLVATGMLAGWPALLVYAIAITDVVPLTLVRPTHNALLPSLSRSPSELTAANAVTSIAEATGILLGPLGAAAILVFAGPGTVVGVLAGIAGLAAVLVFGLKPNPGGVGSQALVDDAIELPEGLGVLGGFRALAADGDARLVVAILSARQLMIGVTDVLFVLLAIEVFGTGESGAAVMSAAIGAGGIIGGAVAFGLIGRRRITPVLVGSAVLFGATFAAIGLAGGLYAPVFLVVGGIGLALMDVAGRTILQRAVRDEVLARVFGILEGMMMAALALGSILVPIVVALTGTGGAILVFAALLPLILVLTWPGLRAIDRRAGVPVRELTLLGRTALLQAMPIPSIEGLARAAAWVTAPAGTVIIREGDPGETFYIVESGSVAVSRGGQPIRSLDQVGDGFGEIALLRDIPRTATVTAIADTVLMTLGRREFLAAVTGHPVVSAEAGRVVEGLLLADKESGES
jgi:MFS family permease